MDFVAVLDQVIALLCQRGRVTYCILQRQCQLDEVHRKALKDEPIYGQRLAAGEEGRVLVWSGETETVVAAAPAPRASTPPSPRVSLRRHAHRNHWAKAATWTSGVQYFVTKPPALR